MTTTNSQIGLNADDGFASDGGIDWEANSGGNNAGWLGVLSREYMAVYSFASPGPSQGATISVATLSTWVKSTTGTPIDIRAMAQKTIAAQQPNDTTQRPFQDWIFTSATTNFSGSPTTSAYQTWDVTSIVQELVSQGSFNGGRMNLVVRNNGMSDGSTHFAEYWDFSDGNDVTKLAKLDITWTASGGGGSWGQQTSDSWCRVVVGAG